MSRKGKGFHEYQKPVSRLAKAGLALQGLCSCFLRARLGAPKTWPLPGTSIFRIGFMYYMGVSFFEATLFFGGLKGNQKENHHFRGLPKKDTTKSH